MVLTGGVSKEGETWSYQDMRFVLIGDRMHFAVRIPKSLPMSSSDLVCFPHHHHSSYNMNLL